MYKHIQTHTYTHTHTYTQHTHTHTLIMTSGGIQRISNSYSLPLTCNSLQHTHTNNGVQLTQLQNISTHLWGDCSSIICVAVSLRNISHSLTGKSWSGLNGYLQFPNWSTIFYYFKVLTVAPYKLHKLARPSVDSSLYSPLSAYPTLLVDSNLPSYTSDGVFDRSVHTHIQTVRNK